MKKVLYTIAIIFLGLTSCRDNDVNIFDKTADERVDEAIASLKADLVAPADGWRVRYQPESESGSFYVLMKFEEDGTVTIKSDIVANDGEFFTQANTYRIDSSLGLELIIESYSFFSFLYEQNEATFLAEYEFNYSDKTSDGELVFTSKTDPSNPTTLVFEEADDDDTDLLTKSKVISQNLTTLASDIDRFSSSLKLTYDNRDLILYISMDDFRRTLNITTASKKTNTSVTEDIGFSSGYLIKGDSIVFDSKLSGNFVGVSTSIKAIKLKDLEDAELDACGSPIATHAYTGVTSNNDNVVLETSLVDANGSKFADVSYFYYAPLEYIFDNGQSMSEDILAHIPTAAGLQLYYDIDLDDDIQYAIGFVLVNADGSVTYALRAFTPQLDNNRITFNFAPDITLFGNTTPDATTDQINYLNTYLDELTMGNSTYVYEYSEDIFEFFNPCSGWSFVFLNGL